MTRSNSDDFKQCLDAGHTVFHRESVLADRRVLGFDKDGALQIDSLSSYGDDGSNQHFVCIECGVTYSIKVVDNFDFV